MRAQKGEVRKTQSGRGSTDCYKFCSSKRVIIEDIFSLLVPCYFFKSKFKSLFSDRSKEELRAEIYILNSEEGVKHGTSIG